MATGKELLNILTDRDFSGSNEDEYAQTLMTIFANVGDAIFPLLEQAERLGKKLDVVCAIDEIIVENIVLV